MVHPFYPDLLGRAKHFVAEKLAEVLEGRYLGGGDGVGIPLAPLDVNTLGIGGVVGHYQGQTFT